MMRYDDPVRLVKELKGAGLSIMVLLSLAPVPVSQKWLEIHSGYSDKPVGDALYYLREHGFALKANGGWLISDGARQLPLRMGEYESRPGDVDENPQEEMLIDSQEVGPVDTGLGSGQVSHGLDETHEADEIPVGQGNKSLSDKSDRNGRCRKISDSLSSSIKDKVLIKDSLSTINKQTRKNSGFDPPTRSGTAAGTARLLDDGLDDTASQDDSQQEILQAYSDCGIRLNRRTRKLAEVISADDVWRAYKELYNQGRHKETGLLIHILEDYAAKGVREESSRNNLYADWEN